MTQTGLPLEKWKYQCFLCVEEENNIYAYFSLGCYAMFIMLDLKSRSLLFVMYVLY